MDSSVRPGHRRRDFCAVCRRGVSGTGEQRSSVNSDERAVADFYRGKVVRIVGGFSPGDGADVYSRILARYLGHSAAETVLTQSRR
jgi:hypothetical protein